MMEKPTPALVAEINALRTMHADELKARYPEILGSAFALCTNCSMLRSEVAYRLQERFYGISLPADIVKAIESAGEPVTDAGRLLDGTRIVRLWKGVEHEIVFRRDGTVEYADGVYKSLSAVARKITGTNWNGKIFFGLKK